MRKNFYLLLISAVALMMASCGDGNAPDSLSNFKITKLIPHQIVFTYTPVNQELKYNVRALRANELTITNENVQQAVQDWFDEHEKSSAYFPTYEGTEEIDFLLDPDTDYCLIIFTKNGGTVTLFDFRMVHMPSMGKFTINEIGKQVHIARANLAYYYAWKTWWFGDDPWEFFGESNESIGNNPFAIDLFGWGTGKNPLNHSTNASDYPTSFTSNQDWGQHSIYGYGGFETGWYTMGGKSWKYIFEKRENADRLYGLATVNGVDGYILLPDDWNSEKSPKSFKPGAKHTENQLTKEEWWQFEALGAVFLPFAGYRYGTSCYCPSYDGYYWTSSTIGGAPIALFFTSYGVNTSYQSDSPNGYSVRLVRDVQ